MTIKWDKLIIRTEIKRPCKYMVFRKTRNSFDVRYIHNFKGTEAYDT